MHLASALSTRIALSLSTALIVWAPRAGAQRSDSALLALDSLLDIRVSTAAKYAQRIGEVGSSVTIVTSDDIERYGYRTLSDVLGSVPGFYVSYDRNYTYVGVRGFSRPTDYNNRILVLIDGNTVNEAIWGSAPMGDELGLSLSSLDRIEVIRGPGSALYGTGAMFGVVNLITKPAALVDGGEVVLYGGSFGERGGKLLTGRRLQNGIGMTLNAELSRSDGQDFYYAEFDSPETNGGIARHLDWQNYQSIAAALARGALRIHGRFSSRTKAFPTGSYESAFNAAGAQTRDDYGLLELTYGQDLSVTRRLTTRTYANWYLNRGGYPYPDTGNTVNVLQDAGKNGVFGSEATLGWDLSSANRLTVGGEFRHYWRTSYEQFYYGVPTGDGFNLPSNVLSGYLQDEHQITGTVSMLGGLRYDRYSATLHAITPRLAMIITPTHRTTFKLLYGEAFRAPSAYEAELSDETYVRNPDLRPERARTAELVWQQRVHAGLLFSTSVFQYRMDGLIDLTTDATTNDYIYRNVGSARARGVETGFDARLGSATSAYANYTYQRTLDEHGQLLTNSPAHLAKAGAALAFTPSLRTAMQLRYESSRRTVYDSETPDFVLADANLVFAPAIAGDHLQLMVRVNNVFNTTYATPGGIEHRQPAIRQDGRNQRVSLRYLF